MKKNTVWAVLAVLLPAAALAQERAPELPRLDTLQKQIRAAEPIPTVAARALESSAAAAQSCPQIPSGAVVGRGIFANDYEVTGAGRKIATIAAEGDGYVMRGADGTEYARAAIRTQGDTRTAAVTGCGGSPMGAIEEQMGSQRSQLTIRDAAGAVVAATPWVDDRDLTAAGSATITVEQHGFADNMTVTAQGVDTQMAVFTAVMINSSAYRWSGERRRENMGPHGRGDR
ncbi:MAG: hypothetical protein NTY77_02640 [Elusimicrobia bacterium]|nr:hypothetical protein [Elusimicrobiota bacterium]